MKYIGEDDLPLAVTVAEFKRATHLREADVESDSAIEDLLYAAQDVVATATGRPIAPGSYEFTFPVWTGGRRWWFPCAPVVSLDAVAVNDEAGDWVDQPLDGLRLVRAHDEPQLLFPQGWAGFSEAADQVRVQATVGQSVSRPVKRAIITIAKEWREADIAIDGEVRAHGVTMGGKRLIKQARYMRPQVMADF